MKIRSARPADARSAARAGLAPTQTPGGVFVIYSAGVGETALDRLSDSDADPNSVFTRSFLPLLTDPSQSLVAVAKETRLRVKSLASTIGATQSPAYYDEIDGDLYLARTDVAATAPLVPEKPRTVPPPPVAPPANLAKSYTQTDPPPGQQYGYIFANSDRVRLTPDMLRGLTRDQLRLARNEIYARRGRFFRDQQLAAYFSRFDWYKPYAWDVPLNPVEQANVNTIAAMER